MKRRRRKRHCRFRRKRRRYRRKRCKTIVKIRIKRICRSRNGRRWSPINAAAVLSGTPASNVAEAAIGSLIGENGATSDVVRSVIFDNGRPGNGGGGGGGQR